MAYSHVIRGEQYNFADLKALLGKSNEPKSGDLLAGIGAKNERERIAAKMALADLPLSEFLAYPILDPDSDDVSKFNSQIADLRHTILGLEEENDKLKDLRGPSFNPDIKNTP